MTGFWGGLEKNNGNCKSNGKDKYRGLSTPRRTVKLSAAPVEMTAF
jgi:hypothetical protein